MSFLNMKTILLFCIITGLTAPLGHTEKTVWLRGTFQEIGSASPVIGHATFTLDLTESIIRATPPKFILEAEKAGFNIEAIHASVQAMPVGETFEIQNNNEFHLQIEKFESLSTNDKPTKLLLIRMQSPNGTTRIPVPLALTSTAIPLLQLALEELAGMEAQLGAMLEEVKKTPPGTLLVGEDKLMNSVLEIKLQ